MICVLYVSALGSVIGYLGMAFTAETLWYYVIYNNNNNNNNNTLFSVLHQQSEDQLQIQHKWNV
jgi:hypothetical protein